MLQPEVSSAFFCNRSRQRVRLISNLLELNCTSVWEQSAENGWQGQLKNGLAMVMHIASS